MATWIQRSYRRFQARSAGQLVRSVSFRLWPFSYLAHRHCAARMRPEQWEATNAAATAFWAKRISNLDSNQQHALDDLRQDGIHRTNISDLCGPSIDFSALQREATGLIQLPGIHRQISQRQSRQGIKWYVVRAFGYRPALLLPPAFATIILHDRILSIVNSYLGLSSRIIYLDLWYNLPVADGEPSIDSERWHRDGEDKRLVKLFLYLSDVDDTAGPLAYIRETHPDGRYGALYPNNPPRGSFPREDLLENAVPVEQLHSYTGGAGTLILYDACGFHRGGRARSKARIALVATYASDAAFDSLSYRLERKDQFKTLCDIAAYAIRADS